MANLARIAGGLRLIFGHDPEEKVEKNDGLDLANKTKADVYELRRLLGVTCPNCKKVGMIGSLNFRETKDIGLPMIPTEGGNEPQVLANHLEKFFRNNFDTPATTDAEILAQEEERERAKTETTGYFCFGCRASIDPILFVDQLLV